MNAPQDFGALFARERWLSARTRHQQVIANRWSMVALSVVLLLVFSTTGSLALPLGVVLVSSALNLGANAAVHVMLRADRFAPWHFWAMIALDSVSINVWAAALGEHGSLALPVLVFAASTYALGQPRAARFFLACSILLYPAARWLGWTLSGAEVEWGLGAAELLILAVTGHLCIAAPASVTRRLARIRTTLAAMEQGDFTSRLPSRHLDDIGFLSVSVNSMAGTVGAMVREIQEGAQVMAGLAASLADTTREVQRSAREIGANTGEVAAAAEAQMSLVAQGGDALDAVTREGEALRAQAARSTAEARELEREAEEHADRVGRAGLLLTDLGEDYRRLAAATDALEAAGDRVRGFVTAIQEIAEQTNLLALNAAIEAARAGEHGRGFAVVAGEIRTLAVQSATSAAEVSGVVEATSAAIAEVRERLGAGSTRIGGVGDVAENGRVALASIVRGLERTVAFVEQIARDVERQAGALGGLRDDMGRVRQIAGASAARAQQTAAAADAQWSAMEELARGSQGAAETAAGLRALAGRFRLASDVPTEPALGAHVRALAASGSRHPVAAEKILDTGAAGAY